ncbi:MAG: hypothetical protein IT204_06160 [Fimbriimonadaceae bacterium]|nr:hypothetical protein [Fimbriimonadaceae bacterium]
MRYGDGAKAVGLLGAAAVLRGGLVNLGFYAPAALAWVLVGTLLAALAGLAPAACERALSGRWARPLLRAVGPVALLWTAVAAAAAARPSPLVAPSGLLALLGLALALLRRPADETARSAVASGLLLWAPGLALLRGTLLHVEREAAVASVVWGSLLGVALGLWALAQPRCRALLPLGLAAALLIRGGVIVASPDPLIDVQAWLRQAPEALLRGENPYAMRLDSPYGTPRARRAGIHDAADPDPPTYPPGMILLGLPAAAGLDPRWVVAAGWLLLAALLGRREPSLVLVGLFPTAAFCTEQAWFDGLLALCLALALRRPGAAAGVAGGAALLIKQPAVLLLPALTRWFGRDRRPWLALLLTVGGVTLPFLLWSPGDYWHDVVSGHWQIGLKANALGLPAWWAARGGHWPQPLGLLLALALAVGAAWRAGSPAAAVAWAAAVGLLGFNLLTGRAYVNFYEAAAAMLLLAAALPEEARAPEGD